MPAPITPPEVDVRVVRSRVEDPDLLADELGSSVWLSRARVVKTDGRSSVLSGEVAGRGVIVKTVVTNPMRSRAPAGIGRTRLSRQWQGAEMLIEHGFQTVEPVLMWNGRSSRGHYAETLVMERVEGRTLLGALAGAERALGEERRLAGEAGRLTGRLVKAGLFNRDHKPSNIILCDGATNGRKGQAGHGPLVLIDTAGVTRLGSRRPERMLFNLVVECVGTGTLPRRGVLLAGLRAYVDEVGAREWRELWRAVERMLAQHGDPTPKDDPLRY
jgi:tRNA A-37 threonylcarbamoyl transferase component Bud32